MLPFASDEKFGVSRYSSLVPTTMTGLPSPRSAPTAGVETIFVPWSATGSPFTSFGTTLCEVESIDAICVRSTTCTENPRRMPSWRHA
jgi:hypothetical protein